MSLTLHAGTLVQAALLILSTALTSAGAIKLLRPLFVRHALDQPTARSSHATPTPAGGGLAVMLAVLGATVFCQLGSAVGWHLWAVVLAAACLTAIGWLDDVYRLPVVPRLACQGLAGLAVAASFPTELALFPGMLPTVIERGALVVGTVWFINLTNFMDGLDWMTVVETLPVSGTIAVLSAMAAVSPTVGIVALAVFGAVLGFAPFNRHVARLFLGDVGSLPLGLLLAWMLIALAFEGHKAAALLLPMYYLADATITLLRRALRREQLSVAHRSHFYQRAVQSGYSVPDVTARVLTLNLLLATLAVLSVRVPTPTVAAICLLAGAAATLAVLIGFNRGRA